MYSPRSHKRMKNTDVDEYFSIPIYDEIAPGNANRISEFNVQRNPAIRHPPIALIAV